MECSTIEVCCNDRRNGLFEHRATAIRFGDKCYETDTKNFKGVAFTDWCSRIRLHRKTFKYISMKEWTGNWCWNSYVLSKKDADSLHEIIKSNGFWRECDY